jgi:glycerol-3-phosphate O-acyltransferase
MGDVVEIPVWLLWLGGALALIGLLDRILAPSLRWVLRRRANRVIDQLNQRLDLGIQPFKLTRRRVLIDRLIYDPAIMEAMEVYARDEDVPREVAAEQVRRYAREIAPAFSASAYFGVAARVSRWISQALYRVRLGYADDAGLRSVDPSAAVVFVMNHRSNLDYVLVTYLASQRSALSYAVGEWARVWPLQGLIRSMGAYFIRRKSRNGLYRRVLARYVQMAREGGVTQAIFPEGGLSLDGRLGAPKLGLLSYIASGFKPGEGRDVIFVPVGINYDRVLEDRLLTSARKGADGAARFKVSLATTVGFIANHFWLRITGRYYRYGYACVGFGAPLSLAAFLTTRDGATETERIADLGDELMKRVGAVVPVLPVSLVATVLLDAGGTIQPLGLKARAHTLLRRLEQSGAHCHVPRGDMDYAVDVGLRMLTLRGIVLASDAGLEIAPGEAGLLRFYANAIAHLIADA